MNKRFLLILAVIAAVFVGLVFVNRDDSKSNNGGEAAQTTNHTFGEGSSGVTLVEYGDFQCPACAGYYPIFSQLKEEYGDRVTFQFRHYPLVSIHQNAMAAHRAAEAAAKQGKFWEMHDLLYERQQAWANSNDTSNVFQGYATELGLNMDQFKTDVASSEINAIINADVKVGRDLGATATPTFVLNDVVIESPRAEIEAFRKVLDDAIAEQQ